MIRMKKTTQLRDLLRSNELQFIIEAHNGLSARIVQEAGFKGIWGSGLSLSASLGVRDNNESSWTQILEILEFMSNATDIPILRATNRRGLGQVRGYRGRLQLSQLYPCPRHSILRGSDPKLAGLTAVHAAVPADPTRRSRETGTPNDNPGRY
jgi:hypothetical protein